MNAHALKNRVSSQNAGRHLISSLGALLLLALCINTARADTITWTNTAGGNWSVAANWDPNEVPGPNDTAQINSAAGTYTVTDDTTATVSNLAIGGAASGVQNLRVPNGVTLTMSSATVNTNGTLTVAGGGEMDLISGLSLYGPLTNSGTINLTSANIYNDGGTNYQGGLVNRAGGQINLNGGFSYYAYIGVSGTGGQDYLINNGALTASGGTTVRVSDFDNTSGTVTNLSGTLALGSFVNKLAGNYYAADGSLIQFFGGTSTNYLTPGTPLVLAGGGQYQFGFYYYSVGNYLEFTNDIIPGLDLVMGTLALGPDFQGGAITNLALDGMTLTNTLPVTGILNATNGPLYGNFTVAGGGVLNGYSVNMYGSVTVAANGLFNAYGDTFNEAVMVAANGLFSATGGTIGASGSLTVAGGGELDLSGGLNLNGPLTNSGTINETGGEIYINNNEATSYGGLVNEAGGQINLYNSSYVGGSGGYDYFINDGALTFYGSYYPSMIVVSDFDTSSGTVTNLSGTLALGNFQGTLAGNFYATNGSVIQFYGGTSANYLVPGTPLVLAGGGQYQFGVGYPYHLAGYLELPTDVIPGLELTYGGLELGPDFQGGAITNLTMYGMTLTNTLPVTGIFNANSCVLYGDFNVASGDTVNVTSSTLYVNPFTISNNVVFNAQYDTFNEAVTVAANGLFNGNNMAINAIGSLTVDEGGELDLISQLSLYGPLTNSGTINMTSGYLYSSWISSYISIYNDGSSGFGGLVNESGGQINIYGNYYSGVSGSGGNDYFINKGALTLYGSYPSTISVSDFDTSGGTVTNLAGTLALGNFQGTLAGNFYATNGSVIQFLGGASTNYLAAGGSLVLAGGGQYQFTSGYLEFTDNVIPQLALAGGTLGLGANFQGGAITNLTLNSITLSNTLPVTGIFNATNCTLYGDFNVAPGDTVNVANSSLYVNPFTIGSGVVFNAFQDIFSEAVTVAEGGLLTINGNLYGAQINPGDSLTVAGGGELDLINALFLYGGLLTNSGTINMTNGEIYIYNDGSSLFGGLVNETGGQINIYDYGYIYGRVNYYGEPRYDYFINDGALTVYTGPVTVSVVDFDPGSGTVTNLAGTLALGNFVNTLAGNYYAANGSVIQFAGGASTNFLTSGTPLSLAGGGQCQFTSGWLELPANIIPGVALMGGTLELGADFQGGAITNLTVSGMTLTNTLAVTGTFTATNGTIIYGNCTVENGGVLIGGFNIDGSLTVAEGGVLDLPGALDLNGPLTNSGTINMTNGYIQIENDGVNYYGGLVNEAGGQINLYVSSYPYGGYSVYGYGGYDYFINDGALTLYTGTATIDMLDDFTNSGTISAEAGMLQLNLVTLQAAGSLNVGLNSANDSGQIGVSGNTALNGAFGVHLNNGFVPVAGDSYTVLTYTSLSGSFSRFSWPAMFNQPAATLACRPIFGDTALTVSVHPLIWLPGTNVVLNANSTPGSQVVLLSSTDLAIPVANWTPVGTNTIDVTGYFSFTNNMEADKPSEFFFFKSP
jgi:fibronectin-binding autotransporter adhesin